MQKTALYTNAEMDEVFTENPLGSYGTEHNCFALSFAQERLWFLEKMLGSGGAYNIAGAVRLQGEVRSEVLERSLQEIIRRHEILRTSFTQVEGDPVQQVHAELPFVLRKIDLYEEHGQPRSEAMLQAQLGAEAAAGFALEEPGLFRMGLWRVGEQEYVLGLVMHHIIADGWSLGVMMRELQQIYGALIEGKSSGLGELPIQYVDYANWQRELLGSGELEEGLEYWRKELAGAPPVVEMPWDFARRQNPGYEGSVVRFSINSDVVKRLKQVCRAEGATLYMVLLAGFEILIGRYSGEKDVVVGSPVAERPQVESEGLIGLFVNLVGRRVRLERGETFRSLLRRVKQKVIAAQPYQHVPFEKVVEQLEQERGLAHMPVVQVVFSWQEGLFEGLQLGSVSGKLESVDTGTAKFDLTLTMGERGEQIEGWMEYSTELFREQTIERMVESFVRLLEGISSGPQQEVMELPLLGEKEQQQLRAWNRTASEYPREKTIVELFEEVAARRKEAVALVYGEEQVSYEELEQRAEEIGRRLSRAGVGVEEMVGLCMERSVEMVAGMVGILKAGGVYVPLDPSYPQERLRLVVEDAGVKVVLTQERLQERLAGLPVSVLCLESESEKARSGEESEAGGRGESGANDKERVKVEVGPENLAYMMYTSGSSGRPKGVAVTHRGVVRLVRNTNYAQLGEQETFLQFAPPSFDASTLEIWGALLNGGRLVVYGGEEASVEELGRELQRYQVTTLWLTAALFHLMVDERVQELGGVTQLLAGGDVLRVDAVEKVRRELPGCRLINGYGPTEGTTFSCCYAVSEGVEMGRSVPIGRPIANTQVYVLDEEMREVPVGVAGELYIGGAGLARGYWRHADLTAEKFVPDGISGEAGVRLYRSGDRGRYLEDGNIEFLGRMDQQVKIRGYRVEPEEVESVLKQHGVVRECVVVVQGESAAEKRLVAYVVPRANTERETDSSTGAGEESGIGVANLAEILRAHLADCLPEYMVPAAFMQLESLPLTPNGKLDRKALPMPEGEAYARHSYEAPQSEIEQVLAGIWQQLLGVERVGRQDHFFEMGGHSLLAMRLLARVGQMLGVELPVARLFARPTLAGLAEAVREARAGGALDALPPIRRISREEELPISIAQQRIWFLAQLPEVGATYHIPVALRLQGELDREALKRSLDEIWARHEALRSVFVAVEEEPRVQFLPEQGGMPWREHDLRGVVDAAERLQALKVEEANARFELSRGPLIRALLVHVQEQEHVLLLTQHHIVSDGWSLGILARELGALYEAFRRRQPSPLAPLGIQYVDYAAWQREWLREGRLEQQIAYWREALAGAPVLLELPTDRPRPPEQSFAGNSVPICIDSELTRRLRELSRRHGTTLFMTLLGAWAAVLARLSGQQEVVIGTPSANRARREIEGLIGFFVNTLALRIDLSSDPSVERLLQRVRATTLAAREHQDLPFEQVVEIVQPPRQMSHTPLFQVMFSWQNNEELMLEFSDVQVSPVDAAYDVAKFDLELGLAEAGGKIVGTMNYATALFEERTIRRHSDYLLRVLKAMAADQEQEVARIDLLGSEERTLLVEKWNVTEAEYAEHMCIHQLFEERVRRTPQATAVLHEERSLSYRELNRQANQLAHYLINLGVRPDEPVAICMERCSGMVIALLGILKAGGAYVPLDPAYPCERLKQILVDAEPRMLLSDAVGQKAIGADALKNVMVIDVSELGRSDSQPRAWSEQPCSNPDAQALGLTSHHLAYVIYTSGSTGTPKGVMVEHRHLAHLVAWSISQFNLHGQSRTSVTAGSAFDANAWEIWPSLCCGAALLLAPESTFYDPSELLRWWRAQALDVSFLTTPLTTLALMDDAVPSGLRYLLTGGDRLQKIPSHLPNGMVLVNNYGPTETTVVATSGVLSGEDKVLHIGRPIANTRIYLLDEKRQPVPLGAVGEIYIGGAGVARGYLKRPELTTERFLKDPFRTGLDARMYKTGDLARYLQDGNIEFLGRNDHQVKIRGFRIELGEIEARLLEHELVQEVVVVAWEDAQGEKRLVAYVVPAGEGVELEVTKLREYVRGRVPEYMAPSVYIVIRELPLTANGKVDRKALPKPERGGGSVYVAPRTEVEERIAAIWAEALRLERVGVEDNFFELGGHSLLASQVIARVRKSFDTDISIRALFEGPTIHQMAQCITALSSSNDDMPELVAVSRQACRIDLSAGEVSGLHTV